jgi:hypothetical protein
MLDVRPARNALKPLGGQFDHLIYISMFTPTHRTMHGRRACPQCLDGGVSRIQPFDLYIDVNTNQMHYAWQAGVPRSSV